ncbi:MAG: T9SS type A sorting domain-containing protein [Crocinitomicaceae bacterium]|nr:T9SS type A sorting domain-containing protein [Flavobacteriales bacterium]NQZ34997.1 T9SS type A sorting domain-containing protein [Crocinitomicaceae bacterium]
MKRIIVSILALSSFLASAQLTDLPVSASQTTIVAGQNVQIITSASQVGYSYILRDNSNNAIVGSPLAGAGNDLIFNTGAITSNTSYNVFGSNSAAVSLSFGNDQINFGDDNRGIDDVLTIAAWIKTGSSSGLRNIVLDYGVDDAGFILRTNANGRVSLDGRDGTNAYKTSGISTIVVTDNQWHYIVGVINLTTGLWAISVDGVLENYQANGLGVSLANTDDLKIGGTFSTSNAYVGEVRDVTIWNKELTEQEVIANMSACLSGSENGIVAHFPLSKGFGTEAIDYSVIGVNGYIQFGGNAWVGNSSNCKYELEMSQIIDVVVGAGSGIFVDSINVEGQGGVSTIITAGGTLQMEAAVLPLNVDDATYAWSVISGTGSASIDLSGVLTGITNGTVNVIATANDGSGITGFATVTISNQGVGLNEITHKKVYVYPNPVQNQLSVDLENGQITDMDILDFSGRIVKSITNNTTKSIDVSELNQGVYILKVYSGNDVSTTRFVKQ